MGYLNFSKINLTICVVQIKVYFLAKSEVKLDYLSDG